MDSLIQDLRNAVRQWRQTPIVTAVALLSLALGIGATLALFSLVDALLLRSLPVHDPHSLIRVVTSERRFGLDVADLSVSTRVWHYLRREQTFADAVFATAADRVNLSREGEVRYASLLYVSGNALESLGIEPAIGRRITDADDNANATPVAMISSGLWQREFAGDPQALTRTLFLDGQAFTIIGVTPPRFFGLEVGRSADVIVPIAARPTIRASTAQAQQDSPWLTIYGRLRETETVDTASAALRAWHPVLREATTPVGPAAASHLIDPPFVVSATQGHSFLRQQYAEPILVLLGAVALVWLIACANLSALVLARFSDRRHELGVRLALGATRHRLTRALVVESLSVAVVGAALGVWLARSAVAAVVPLMTSPAFRGLPPDLAVSLDARLIVVAITLALISGIVAGFAPAWRASRVSPQESLSTSARGGLHGRRTARAMRVMVAAQVALTLVLVTGAALLVRSFVALTTADAGVEPDRVLIAVVNGEIKTASDPQFARLEAIQHALAAIPGVDGVSAGIITPLSGGMAAANVQVPGTTYDPPPNMPAGAMAPFNRVLPGFFRVVGTPVLQGREFDERDNAASQRVAVINESFAERHFRGRDPLGRKIVIGKTEFEIVGVVADSRQVSLKELRAVPMAFGLVAQQATTSPIASLRFALSTETPDAVRSAVVSSLRSIDPRLAVEFRTMRDEADASVNRERLLAWLGGLFATLALAMAVIGLYGTFTYAVVRRRSEIGVRMALGAARGDIMRMVLRDAAVVLACGAALGLAGAFAASRVVQSLLFALNARDPWTLAIAAAAVIAAAALASFFPARRASAVEPLAALRAE